MSQKIPRQNHQILEEASTWFVAFRSQDVGEDTRRGFHDWLKRSPEHIGAYLEIAAIYAEIPVPDDVWPASELIAKARSSPDINVVPLSPVGMTTESLQKMRRGIRDPLPRRERLSASRLIAAALMLVFVSVGAWLYTERNTYGTGVGEQLSITMPDGSIVELNARSKVRVAFRDRQRDVELLEGQALFRVAKDRSRPFVVRAGATSVRAVGTQFDVYRKSTGITVTVLEGRVAVVSKVEQASESPAPETSAHAPVSPERVREAPADPKVLAVAPTISREILLAAGEQVTVTSSQAQRVERPNIAAATAWTQHQLVFDGTPLSEVLEEFRRYTTRRLVVDSPELANLRISGQYTSTNPDSLLRFLSLQKGVVITDVNGETHLRQE